MAEALPPFHIGHPSHHRENKMAGTISTVTASCSGLSKLGTVGLLWYHQKVLSLEIQEPENGLGKP